MNERDDPTSEPTPDTPQPRWGIDTRLIFVLIALLLLILVYLFNFEESGISVPMPNTIPNI